MKTNRITLLSRNFLALVDVLQSHNRLFISQTRLAQALELSEPDDHVNRARYVFHEVLGAEFVNAGVQMDEPSFQALLNLKITEEVRATPDEQLAEKFAFAAWLHHGTGGIFEIVGKIQD
jgi:hypothetical protein